MRDDYFENAMNEALVAAECAEIHSKPYNVDPDLGPEETPLMELSDSYFGLKMISMADDERAEDKLRKQLVHHFYEDTRKRQSALSSIRAAQIKIEADYLLRSGSALSEHHKAALKAF